MNEIVIAVIVLGIIGVVLGFMLALASKVFAVKTDARVEEITAILPGANCGGCGYAGCAALAQAIVDGKAAPDSCKAGGEEAAKKISAVMGIEAGEFVRMRAQVMCSGTSDYAKRKYIYEGIHDCRAAARLGGGDKLCPNGCIGHGTCAQACAFDAISVINGVAVVDYKKCGGCGACVKACPKNIIKLIPFNSKHWVGCMSVDKGIITKSYCEVGCISCRICEKNCPSGAITVDEGVAHIDHTKCTECGVCVEKCPRKIIWSDISQRINVML